MSPALERIAPPAVILALALLRIALGDPFVAPPGDPAPRVEPPAISASARAVLDGLEIGDTVGSLQVVSIGGPRDGQLAIELRGEAGGMRAWVARRGATDHAPPLRAERFDLLYGPPSPGAGAACSDAVSMAVLEALARRIDAGGAEPPSDM
jgi:hypothetical protein